MTFEQIRDKLQQSLNELYAKEKDLIKNAVHERTIASKLACFAQVLFKDWKVDSEYNRSGQIAKRDLDGGLILPDIIIHHRTPDLLIQFDPDNNLVAIEIKGYWNGKSRSKDEQKLRDIKTLFGYQYLFRIELNKENAKIIQVL